MALAIITEQKKYKQDLAAALMTHSIDDYKLLSHYFIFSFESRAENKNSTLSDWRKTARQLSFRARGERLEKKKKREVESKVSCVDKISRWKKKRM